MDKLSFKRIKVQYEINDKPTMTYQILINGKSLLNLVKQVEIPLAKATNEVNIAGSYAPLTIENLTEELSPAIDNKAKECVLLGCSCGCVECWPLYVQIEQSENLVIWHNFRNPFRKWNHSKLGPFIFDKKEYMKTIKQLFHKTLV